MDDIICGLNKVVCKATTSTYNSYWVKITNGKWTSSKQMSSGSVTFLVPSIPAPGKKTYTISLSSTQNGSAVYQVETELGFGDSTVIYLGSTSYINEKDTIILGTGLGASKSGNKMTINHANSGVTSGSYGPSSALTPSFDSGSFNIPYVTIDARGHVTSASNKSITIKHPTSGVTSGSYGESSAKTITNGSFNVPYMTVDSKGHVTSVSNKSITINASKIDVLDYEENTASTYISSYDKKVYIYVLDNLKTKYGIDTSKDKILIVSNPALTIDGPGTLYPNINSTENGYYSSVGSSCVVFKGTAIDWTWNSVDDNTSRKFKCKLVVLRG